MNEYTYNEYTMQIDVTSLISVHKLRVGNRPRTMNEAKHIYLTTNGALACVSNSIENGIHGEQIRYLPSIVTDTFIGTMLWLHYPQKCSDILDRKLIEHCCSILQPKKTSYRKGDN